MDTTTNIQWPSYTTEFITMDTEFVTLDTETNTSTQGGTFNEIPASDWFDFNHYLQTRPTFEECIQDFNLDFLIPALGIVPSNAAFTLDPEPYQTFSVEEKWVNFPSCSHEQIYVYYTETNDNSTEVGEFCGLNIIETSVPESQDISNQDFLQDDLLEAEKPLAEAQDEENVQPLLQSPGSEQSVDSGFSSLSDSESSVVDTSQNVTQEVSDNKGVDNAENHSEPVQEQKQTENNSEEKSKKPEESYMEIIAQCILASDMGRVLLAEIYQYAYDNNPFFKTTKCAWRNSIRHNLSVNECFIKAGRARNGRGFYWAIHPACREAFKKGEFSRRLARAAVQKSQRLQCTKPQADRPSPQGAHMQSRYPPVSSTPVRGYHYHPYTRITNFPASTPSYYSSNNGSMCGYEPVEMSQTKAYNY